MKSIGKIQKLYGKKGELVILLYDHAPDPLPACVYLNVDGIDIPFFYQMVQDKGGRKIICTFDDFMKNEWAEEFIGKEIFCEEAMCQEVDAGEEGLDALVGFGVKDKHRGLLGKIVEFLDYPNNPVFRIDHKGKNVFMPVHEDFILQLDATKKVLHVHLPEGLIDAYLE